MGLFAKGRRGQGRKPDLQHDVLVGTMPPAPRPREKEADMFGDRGQSDEGQANTFVGRGSQITGKLNFEGSVRLEGQVEGEVSAQESVLIGEQAVVKARISADSVIITGKVTGDITARRRVEIRAPGKLYGNITTPSLVIHDGVVFEGHCSMGAGEVKDVQKASRVGNAAEALKGENKITPLPTGDRAPEPVSLKL